MIKRKDLYFVLFVALVFPLTRLLNLLIIPIFTDEAIYAYWAQVALNDPVNRFISLEDGKQPLYIWAGAFFQSIFPDPLVAMRMVSVLAGLGLTIAIYFIAKNLFNSKTAKIAAALYIIMPFGLLYDRMGLYDSFLSALCAVSFLLTIKMAKKPQLDYALLNGIVLGLGLITKSSASLFLYLIPFSIILFDFKNKDLRKNLAKWLVFTSITAILSLIIYNSLRVSPLFYLIDRKNHEFIRSFGEVLSNPFLHFKGNLDSLFKWQLNFNGPLLVLATLASMIYGAVKKKLEIILLAIYILAPVGAELLFNQVLYPRFSLFF